MLTSAQQRRVRHDLREALQILQTISWVPPGNPARRAIAACIRLLQRALKAVEG